MLLAGAGEHDGYCRHPKRCLQAGWQPLVVGGGLYSMGRGPGARVALWMWLGEAQRAWGGGEGSRGRGGGRALAPSPGVEGAP